MKAVCVQNYQRRSTTAKIISIGLTALRHRHLNYRGFHDMMMCNVIRLNTVSKTPQSMSTMQVRKTFAIVVAVPSIDPSYSSDSEGNIVVIIGVGNEQTR